MTLPEPRTLLTIAAWRRYLTQQTGTLAWSLKLPALIARGDGPQLRFSDGDPMTEQEAARASKHYALILSSDLGLWFESRGHVIEHEHEHRGASPCSCSTADAPAVDLAPPPPEDEPRKGPIAPALREELRERARQRIRAIRRAERRDPLLPEIANYVASWMAQHEIYGSHGHPLSAETVRRHALIGILKTA